MAQSSGRAAAVQGAGADAVLLIADMLEQDAQFIIATHSPILLGFPGATIYSCDRAPLERVAYEELDHVVITRDFLNGPERYLKHLLERHEQR